MNLERSRGQRLAIKRGGLRLMILAILGVTSVRPADAQTLDSKMAVLIKAAKDSDDAKAKRRLLNLQSGLLRVQPSHLQGLECGKSAEPVAIPQDELAEIIEQLGEKVIERYLPAVAGAISSATAAGVASFLTPEKIASDAVYILNQSESQPSEDVRAAARQLLADTQVDSFKKLDSAFTTKIVVCSF